MVKTNAMRLLERAKIPYRTAEYEVDETDLSGVHAADLLGVDPGRVFKTLVARGEKQGILVFVIPASEELDLKKCALAAKDKKIELVSVRELPALTGYVRGGCSPIGMKKKYPVFIDAGCFRYEEIYVSAGQRGHQIVITPKDLVDFTEAKTFEQVKNS
ncbi:MAG: Cys-tRNA(Pro) deacylase [Lachnospiraceae bacterium]|nr:Cys-tRNA(Pro) deacylase [Lachnospiraceae bacterium]